MILPTPGIHSLLAKYPPGFDVILKPTMDCIIQGITERDDILEHLYEDTCEGLLVRRCHCNALRHDCSDCEDMMHIDSLVSGLLDNLLAMLLKSDLVVDEIFIFMPQCQFFDYQVNVIDVDSISIDLRN